MRTLGFGAAALCVAALTAACSGSGETGSSGGWRVSGAHIHVVDAPSVCATAAPVLDTFSSTPSPQPGCSPQAGANGSSSPNPAASTAPVKWQPVHVEEQYHGSSSWHPIYTTYTAPPGTGIYQPMVHATNQPMPTPLYTPTPTPRTTTSPLPTQPPFATTPPGPVLATPTPY